MEITYKGKNHIHFIGIGGISMSGLAEMLAARGMHISGSDAKKSDVTEHLKSLGVEITYGQSADNITDDIDLVVYTAAVHPDNPEYTAASKAGIPLMTRATLLGELMHESGNAIAVSGTHGKTTTTGMLSYIYMQAALDPTVLIGGILPGIKGNVRIGKGASLITEACEYTNSFLEFYPKTAIILNIEAEHLDFFKDLDDIRNSFKRFCDQGFSL